VGNSVAYAAASAINAAFAVARGAVYDLTSVISNAARAQALIGQDGLNVHISLDNPWPVLKAQAEFYVKVKEVVQGMLHSVGAKKQQEKVGVTDEFDFNLEEGLEPLPPKKSRKSLKNVDSMKDESKFRSDEETVRAMEPFLVQLDFLSQEIAENYSQLQPVYVAAYKAWVPDERVKAQWDRWSPRLDENSMDAMRRREEEGDIMMRARYHELEISKKLIRFFTLLATMLHLAPKRRFLSQYVKGLEFLIQRIQPSDHYPYNSLASYPEGTGRTLPASVALAHRFTQLSKEFSGLARRDFTLDELRRCLEPSNEPGYYFSAGGGRNIGALLREILSELGRSRQLPSLAELLTKSSPKSR
jgi:hypothetical protein